MLTSAEALPRHMPFESGDCETCHLPHAAEFPGLLTAPVGQLCRGCHDTPETAPASGTLHAPAREECTSCHQPHASATEPFLLAPARALCVTCHTGVAEQLETEIVHPPAEEAGGCLTCHGPHATGHPGLLLSDVANGCLGCHDGASADFSKAHLGFAASTLDCAECHDPHASRMAGMLLPEMHLPFSEGDCTVCHQDGRQVSGGVQ
jgi:predicted CXXCH cytochrome family protein